MHNAFLVVRTVFFALLTYFHVLVFVFALWNILTATSSGMSAPGASVFLLISSVLVFVLVPIASLAEIICAKARPAQVRVECAWMALMSIFQLAASIDVTVNGPPMHCQSHSPWAMCASSSLLVHISWLVTLIIFSYCLTICVAAATHAATLPDVWVTPVPHVPWFSSAAEAPAPVVASHLPTHKHSKISSSSSFTSEESCAVSKYIAEQWEKLSRAERQPEPSGPILFTPGRQSPDPSRPTWAREHRVRRGVHDPFSKPLPKLKEPPMALALPPRTHSRQAVTSRDSHAVEVSKQRETGKTTETTRTASSSTLGSRTTSVFPHKIANPDLPIPRPDLSGWVRADAVGWVSGRTERTTSP